MDRDDDILAALPGAPPAAPMRREAAITAALARFDGADAAPAAHRPRTKTNSWWTRLQRPQMGALVAAVLVVGISVPLAMRMVGQPIDGTSGTAAPDTPDAAPPAMTQVTDAAPAAGPAKTMAPATAKRNGVREDVAARDPGDPAESPAAAKPVAAPPPPTPPPPPPPPAPPPRMMAQAEARGSVAAAKRSDTADRDIVVSAGRRSSTMSDVPVAVSAAPAVDRTRGNGTEIIVTGAKISAPKRAPRGDWNACTVDDPSQSLSRCTRLVTQGNRKTRERAETHLADGLVQAWQGDTDAAVANFDKAIAVAPQLSIVYLNRGLVYDRKGDIDRAIADLDLAVRYAPNAARAYYIRSLLLRKNGDDDKASADEKRAIELDRRYKDVIE